MNLLNKIFLASFLLLAVSFTLLHHGWANYDQEKVLDYTGVIQDPTYENPHSTMKIEYEEKEWLVILAPASRMNSRGLSAEMLKEDIPVRVVGYPHKEKDGEMRAERIFIDGKKYELR
ncbi:MAG: DUF6152 family protein [Anditalea sp.]